MKILGFIFLGLLLIAGGICIVKFGLFDQFYNWIKSLFN